jgi:hypothetical protein
LEPDGLTLPCTGKTRTSIRPATCFDPTGVDKTIAGAPTKRSRVAGGTCSVPTRTAVLARDTTNDCVPAGVVMVAVSVTQFASSHAAALSTPCVVVRRFGSALATRWSPSHATARMTAAAPIRFRLNMIFHSPSNLLIVDRIAILMALG